MSGASIALDTNQAIAVLNNTGNTQQWLSSFTDVFLPVIVIGELRFGALNSAKSKQNMAHVDALVARCNVRDITTGTAAIYADARARLKAKGKPIPENDLWIAAICLEHGLPLATADGHFANVDGLSIVQP